MTREEKNMTIDYLKGMQEGYIEGEGYERHPLPEWYALDKAIEAKEIARLYEDFEDDEHKVVEYSQSRSQYDELIQVIKYARGYEHIYCMFPYGTPDERRERREKDGNKEC